MNQAVKSHAVKISEEEMKHLREAAPLQSRSIAGQAEHWIRLGRAFERDPRFGFAKVEQALRGLIAPMDLNDEEQDEYLDRLGRSNWEPSRTEDAFFAEMRGRGEGVGMDDDGRIVFGSHTRAAD